MAKWIVEASPIRDHSETAGAVPAIRSFMTDNAAKAFVKEMIGKQRIVTVRSAPGTKSPLA
jgi:hypothetical protein